MGNQPFSTYLTAEERRGLDFLFDSVTGEPTATCRLPSCNEPVAHDFSAGRPKWFHTPSCAQTHRRRLTYLTRACAALETRLDTSELTHRESQRLQAILNWLSAQLSLYASTPVIRTTPRPIATSDELPEPESHGPDAEHVGETVRSALREHQTEVDERRAQRKAAALVALPGNDR